MAVEQVSANILKILGLETTDEIDMQSYKGFLREKLVEISMGKGGLSREEEMIVREEFQRVKGSRAVKVKKTAINPQAVFNRQLGAGGGLVKYVPPAPGSLARRVIPQVKAVGDENVLDKIYAVVLSIQKNLFEEEKQKKKSERDKKAKKDKEEKAAKESSLEKAAKGIVGALEKTFKPVIDIFARIRNAIMLLLLGWAANRLLDWIKDPKNLKTFNAIVDFLSRNAGKLLLLFVALNNPLIKIVRWLGRNMISFLVRMIADLTKGKGLLKGLRGRRGGGALRAATGALTNPATMATAGVIGGSLLANEVTGQRKAAGVQAENKARAQAGQGLGLQGVGGVGDMSSTTPYGMLQGVDNNYDEGGVVEGPSGIDKVPANLTEGEVVISKPAVKTFGEDFLLALNKLGGGTNRPTYSGGRMYAAGGGIAVTSRRGPRGGRMHQGTDIGAPKGTPLFAFTSGRIQEIRREGQGDANYGNSVYWIDSNGNGHLYAHLDAFARGLTAGMEFKKGKMLGTVGSTGRSSGPHLHWEMARNPNDVGRNGPTLMDPLRAYGFMTPFEGKPLPGDGLEDPKTPASPDDYKPTDQAQSITFASEKDRRLMSAYLNYITQPMGRGLDILPTIDQVSGVPGGAASAGPVNNPVPTRPAASPDASRVTGAAHRQIASPTR